MILAAAYRYVPYALIDRYMALGWTWDGEMMHAPHGCYAVLMEWEGDGEPPEPPPGHGTVSIAGE